MSVRLNKRKLQQIRQNLPNVGVFYDSTLVQP